MRLILDSLRSVKRKRNNNKLFKSDSTERFYLNCDKDFSLYTRYVRSLLDELSSELDISVLLKLASNFNKELESIIKGINNIELEGFWIKGNNTGYKFYSLAREEYEYTYESYGMSRKEYEKEMLLVQQLEKKFLTYTNFYNNVLVDSKQFSLIPRKELVYLSNPKYKLDLRDMNPYNYFINIMEYLNKIKRLQTK